MSRLRRRKLVNQVAEAAATLAALAAVGLLVVLVWSVGSRGIGAIDLEFFVEGPPLFGQTGGGIAPALVGSLVLVALATAFALPVGVLIALFVGELATERVGRPIRVVLDVLN